MAAGFDKVPEDQQFAARLADMSARISRLESEPVTIPVLDTDPDVSSRVKLWFLYDGRLRSRVNGTIREYATVTTPGSGTSAVLKPVTTSPQQYRQTFDATWSGTYTTGTGVEADASSAMTFGPRTISVAGLMAAFGFGTAVRDALVGATVQRVELRFVAQLTGTDQEQQALLPVYGQQGYDKPVASNNGLGSITPATLFARSQSQTDNVTVAYRDSLMDAWQVLNNWYSSELQSGRVAAFTIDPTAYGSSAAGQLASSAQPMGQTPQLRVTYTR